MKPTHTMTEPGTTALRRFADFLATVVAERASDLHLASNRPPAWRLHGRIESLA